MTIQPDPQGNTAQNPGNPLARMRDCVSNPEHGLMVIRPIERQTSEQKWCGIWYDCKKCHSSLLIPSRELTLSLEAQKAKNNNRSPEMEKS